MKITPIWLLITTFRGQSLRRETVQLRSKENRRRQRREFPCCPYECHRRSGLPNMPQFFAGTAAGNAARAPMTRKTGKWLCANLEKEVPLELVAQSVEQRTFNAWVLGSIPSELTSRLRSPQNPRFLRQSPPFFPALRLIALPPGFSPSGAPAAAGWPETPRQIGPRTARPVPARASDLPSGRGARRGGSCARGWQSPDR